MTPELKHWIAYTMLTLPLNLYVLLNMAGWGHGWRAILVGQILASLAGQIIIWFYITVVWLLQ